MMGFHTTLDRRRTRVARTAFSERGLFCAHSGTLAGLYPARRWPMERHVRTQSVRPADSHRFNSRWPPVASPPQDVAGAAARHPAPSSGRAYGRPSEASVLAASECITSYTLMPPNNYASVGKPALPIPAVAQDRVGFLPVPRTRSVLVCERDAKRLVNAVNCGVSASEER
ncbi:hypothetical protein HLASF_1068 [Halanaeroarchaeum sulfurireducens]|uniref:Uncharacterized protein n=1 Tax=Halanaeroarchaeum sulfurireducens TaxID=1604004 RepID=A0A0F7P9U8_9EURY|nr:hypothetical protein HLASF_1068 [Halanaeroarchaeum sulfurireducens]ALG81953.1 hypothetical protein HLASA_1057 [Halanaeroarchaeum sulfurireducens]